MTADLPTTSLPTLELRGTPRERGEAYGEFARAEIAHSIGYYERLFATQTGLGWDAVTALAGQWVDVSRRHAPHLVEEMEGLAAGSGRDFLEILTLNARGEIAYDTSLRRAPRDSAGLIGQGSIDDEAPDGCSSFALLPEASGDGHTYAGQNWDWREPVRPTLMVLRIVQDPLPTIVMHVEAGQVGRQGANSAGIALNANGLGGRFDDTVGVPQALIRRKVLDSASVYDALGVLSRTPQHIASNALVTHRDGWAVDLETTPGPHHALHPRAGVLAHGNHYLGPVPPQLAATHRPRPVDSLFRVPRLEAALADVRSADGTGETRRRIAAAFSDHFGYPHSVCTHPDPASPEVLQWSTLLSSCVDLTTGDYLIAAGPPCTAAYLPAPWNLYDGPAGPAVPVTSPVALVSPVNPVNPVSPVSPVSSARSTS